MDKLDKYSIDFNCYYDPATHYWVEINGNEARIGMSSLVQETNGSFVAIAFEGLREVKKGQSFGTAEAEKYVGPLNSPVSGIITEVNNKVIENSRLINTDPYGEGWLVKMELTNKDNEMPELIFGQEEVNHWFRNELDKFEKKGWIAQ